MRTVAVALLVAYTTASFAASTEPFASFRFIDQQLSVLNQKAAAFHSGADAKAQQLAEKEMLTALIRIRQRCRRLETLYRARRSRYGVRMFTALDRDAAAAERALNAVRHNRAAGKADLEKATLALVLRYQSLSSNYGANHCEAGQWACCQPRRDPETNQQSGQGCRWMCVSRAQSCSGFVGPKTLR